MTQEGKDFLKKRRIKGKKRRVGKKNWKKKVGQKTDWKRMRRMSKRQEAVRQER